MKTKETKQQNETYIAPEATVVDLAIQLAFLGEDDGSAGGFDDDDW
ncbi:MAG: hypothetical protein ACOYEG_14265 [Petrimonas sp.]|jgi:hypothetical protein